jgi:ABC-type Fe3+ transport system substrate-binding protein
VIITRVQDATGSHIEPPLDATWTDLTKLQWQAAVVAHDTGLTVQVRDRARLNGGRPIDGWYGISVGSNSGSAYDFHEAWTFLTGVAVGASQAATAR